MKCKCCNKEIPKEDFLEICTVTNCDGIEEVICKECYDELTACCDECLGNFYLEDLEIIQNKHGESIYLCPDCLSNSTDKEILEMTQF